MGMEVPRIKENSRSSLLAKAAEVNHGGARITLSRIRLIEEEKRVLEDLCFDDLKVLTSVRERADGMKQTDPLKTGWKPPLHIRRMPDSDASALRRSLGIMVQGEEVPHPIRSFKDMKFPNPVLKKLKEKGIINPTPIQMQALPVALSGRDMLGLSYTGSGKSLVFILPLVMLAFQEEVDMPVIAGEGPFGLVVCPSRELANQTYEIVQQFLEPLKESGYLKIRTMLCIGGIDMRPQLDIMERGVHIVVATPGRLKDFLSRKLMNLDNCIYVALDEADRLLDSGFDDDISEIFDYLKGQRQTLLFSATMPTKVQKFAKTALVRPITVNVGGRAGAANLNIIQEVHYVNQKDKLMHLLNCLQKTAPPVLVFCENKLDVDKVNEYLLLKGVEAVGIHGGKDQCDRQSAIDSFKRGLKDVLVATDVTSKGLDFPGIEHVINFDMPVEIENYIHRIGRTGRCGKTGIATTFVDDSVSESTLLDLKELLKEAKQSVPSFLAELRNSEGEDEGGIADVSKGEGCAYCGGLGHRVMNCCKLDRRRRIADVSMRKDYFGSGGYRSEF